VLADLLKFFLLAAFLQYIVGGAVITEPLRKRLPEWLQYPVRCPACSGFWIGLLLCWLQPFEWYWGPVMGLVGVPVIRGFMVELSQ
jgi:hypothetical protein